MRDCKMLWQAWKNHPAMDAELLAELTLCANDEKELQDRFYQDLAFGTGGLRGVLGAGTNRMNIFTVAKATRGFAGYLNETFAQPSCAIAYDSRNKSAEFAKISAATLAAAGIRVYLYQELMPTPMLSFAVRHFGCSGGIVITASHNPAKYNGYKVYGADGCQITLEAADKVLSYIDSGADFVPEMPDFTKELAAGRIDYIGEDVLDAYQNAVLAQSVEKPKVPLKVVYSPLNGAGNKPVRRILAAIGNVEVTVVPEQEKPDGDFPTCSYPNPEIKETMQLAVELAAKTNADLCFATDPDCDRVGVAVVENGKATLINGNEMGVMLFDFVCQGRIASGTMPKNPVAVKTIVTTEMAVAVAKAYGVELRNVLTGFKFIGEQIGLLENEGREDSYIFGFEESYGYLSGSFVRDKDAVNAAMLICEMAAHYKATGKNLLMVLDELCQKYGYYKSELLSFTFEGAAGMDKMTAFLNFLRENRPSEFGAFKVLGMTDYQNDNTGLPKSDVLAFELENECHLVVRPSGTEPKLKMYVTAAGDTAAQSEEKAALLSAACTACVEKNS